MSVRLRRFDDEVEESSKRDLADQGRNTVWNLRQTLMGQLRP